MDKWRLTFMCYLVMPSIILFGCNKGVDKEVAQSCAFFKVVHSDLNIVMAAFYSDITWPSTYTYPSQEMIDLARVKGNHAVDPLGNRYFFVEDEKGPILYSAGINGKDEKGNNDDIVAGSYELKSYYCKDSKND